MPDIFEVRSNRGVPGNFQVWNGSRWADLVTATRSLAPAMNARGFASIGFQNGELVFVRSNGSTVSVAEEFGFGSRAQPNLEPTGNQVAVSPPPGWQGTLQQWRETIRPAQFVGGEPGAIDLSIVERAYGLFGQPVQEQGPRPARSARIVELRDDLGDLDRRIAQTEAALQNSRMVEAGTGRVAFDPAIQDRLDSLRRERAETFGELRQAESAVEAVEEPLTAFQQGQLQIRKLQEDRLTRQGQRESQQFAQREDRLARQFQQQFGLSQEQSQEAVRQFNLSFGLEQDREDRLARQFQQEFGLSRQRAQEAVRQFNLQFGLEQERLDLSERELQQRADQFAQQFGLDQSRFRQRVDEFRQEIALARQREARLAEQFQQEFGLAERQFEEAKRQFDREFGLAERQFEASLLPNSMEELITDSLVSGQFDRALAFADFRDRPTSTERFQAALQFAQTPGDASILGAVLRGEGPEVPAGRIPVPGFVTQQARQFFQPFSFAEAFAEAPPTETSEALQELSNVDSQIARLQRQLQVATPGESEVLQDRMEDLNRLRGQAARNLTNARRRARPQGQQAGGVQRQGQSQGQGQRQAQLPGAQFFTSGGARTPAFSPAVQRSFLGLSPGQTTVAPQEFGAPAFITARQAEQLLPSEQAQRQAGIRLAGFRPEDFQSLQSQFRAQQAAQAFDPRSQFTFRLS